MEGGDFLPDCPTEKVGPPPTSSVYPRVPQMPRISWPSAEKADKIDKTYVGIHHGTLDGGYDSDMEGNPEFFEIPRFRGVIEWMMSLIFDCGLMIVEAAINLWLATTLYREGMVAEYRAIIIVLILPSLLNPLIWQRLKQNYRMSCFFITTMLFIGFPSPLFLYIWHLYLSMFTNTKEAERSKLLSNTFRVVHAVCASLPLMLINLITLINELRVDGMEDYAIDIELLKKHMGSVEMHGLAFFFSFMNFVRAASLFNERKTYTLLFGTIALPFTILTSLSRVLILAIVIAFIDPEFTALLFIGLTGANVALFWSCRKNTKLIKGKVIGLTSEQQRRQTFQPITQATSGDTNSTTTDEDLINQGGVACCSLQNGSEPCLSSCCPNVCKGSGLPTSRAGRYVVSPNQSTSCWSELPKLVSLSFCSIVMPFGYGNDVKSHHPRIKGGIFVLLNFVVNMAILGVTLGYTIMHKVPNTFHGVSIPQPSLKVEVPSSKVIVQAGGLDVSLNLPNTKLDLGSMPTFSASLHTDESDSLHAVIAPIVLAAICLPFVIMRAAMMELDCFVTRRKQLGDDFEQLVNSRKGQHSKKRSSSAHHGGESVAELLAKNVESTKLKARLYVTLCCSILAILVMTAFLMLLGVLLYLNVT